MYTETQKVNAIQESMALHDVCMGDPDTQQAAFGMAVSLVTSILGISIKLASMLVEEELERRRAQVTADVPVIARKKK